MTPISISLKSLARRVLLVAFALAVTSATLAAQQVIATHTRRHVCVFRYGEPGNGQDLRP